MPRCALQRHHRGRCEVICDEASSLRHREADQLRVHHCRRTQPAGCGIFSTGSSLFLPGIVVKGTSTACTVTPRMRPRSTDRHRRPPGHRRRIACTRTSATVAIASRTMAVLDLVTMVCNLVGLTTTWCGSQPTLIDTVFVAVCTGLDRLVLNLTSARVGFVRRAGTVSGPDVGRGRGVHGDDPSPHSQ